MTGRVALCVDETTALHPEIIGLEGERLESLSWLDVYRAGEEARSALNESGEIDEAWVVSCDDVDPINLAASLKADHPDLHVCLVSPDPCGSLRSRAHNAQIDEVLGQSLFAMRYESAKRNREGTAEPVERHQASVESRSETPPSKTDVIPAAELLPIDEGPVTQSAGTITRPRIKARPEPEAAVHPRIHQQIQTQPTIASNRAFLLPIVSGSGGAGKSAVSSLAALMARNAGYRTMLMDCDLQFGDMDFMVGQESPLRIDEALARPDLLERETERSDRLPLLAAPARLESAEEVAHQLPGLIERLSSSFDVIVANTGASWAEQHAALLERSTAALFLIDQRASSVRACKHALELCARCGIAANPFHFALNRCAKGAPLTSVDASCALRGAPVFELKEGGPDVEEYLSSGNAAELLESKNEFAKSLEQVLKRLLPYGIVETSVQTPTESPLALRRKRNRRFEKIRSWK